MGVNGGIVAEGRDIGTSVFPDADLKVFLTATTQERAKRRFTDLKSQGFEVESLEIIEEQIIQRDQADKTRAISPLMKANDAIELITDGMSIPEVINSIMELFRLNIPQEIWPSN